MLTSPKLKIAERRQSGIESHNQVDRIFAKPVQSEADIRTLSGIPVSLNDLQDDGFDYSKVVVKKPWGYEYLIFQNGFVAIWILFIKEGFETSLHCHPRKKTSITVLQGEALCSVLEQEMRRRAGDMMLAGAGVFHRTRSISEGGTFVMEIETPVNKRDLVRFVDAYGREKLGYEDIDQMSFNLENYNYTSLIDSGAYYNVKKRFGNCSIRLAEFAATSDFQSTIRSSQWDVVSILKGGIIFSDGRPALRPGDSICKEDYGALEEMSVDGKTEALIINSSDTSTRLSDFIVSHLKSEGLRDIFFVPGTSNAHLVDAVGRDTEIRSLAFQTEAGASLAAEAYAKLSGKPGVIFVSAGSSSLGALGGIANSWIDSAPLLAISGQSRPTHLGTPGEEPIRQLANKELGISNIVNPITKYFAGVRDSREIREVLTQAINTSREGRPGPAWLDIPIDIQGMNIDEAEIAKASGTSRQSKVKRRRLGDQVRQALAMLAESRRPVILAGYGIRAAGAQAEFLELARELSIPILTSRRGADLVPDAFPLFFGRPGTYGQRAANFVIQNCDLLLSLGSRLSLPLIGRNYKGFARAAKKIIVDIDREELSKTTVPADLAIQANAADFLHQLRDSLQQWASFCRPEWIQRCEEWRMRYCPEHDYGRSQGRGVNPYRFVDSLSDCLVESDILVVDGGPSLDYVMQAFRLKSGQRIISSPGLEHQGFALPGAIGAAVGALGRRVVCLCDKKGFQVNLPELQTISNAKLPIKVFLFNSKGDRSVQQVQASYFGGRYIGFDRNGIIGSLNIAKIGEAYQIPTETICEGDPIAEKIDAALATRGPILTEVRIPEGQEVIPRLVFTVKPDGKWISKPIEDMYPFLDRRELKDTMMIDLMDED